MVIDITYLWREFELGKRAASESLSLFAALEARESTPAFLFLPDWLQTERSGKGSPSLWNELPPRSFVGGGKHEKWHCFLSHPLYLPPVPSGACLYQTFTHLLLTLELFRANKPLKKGEMLPGSLLEYLNAKLSSLCWLVNSVDNFYSWFNSKRRVGRSQDWND